MKGRWVIEALMVYVSWIVDGDAIRVDKADLRSRERQKISPSPNDNAQTIIDDFMSPTRGNDRNVPELRGSALRVSTVKARASRPSGHHRCRPRCRRRRCRPSCRGRGERARRPRWRDQCYADLQNWKPRRCSHGRDAAAVAGGEDAAVVVVATGAGLGGC